ncbi:MAG: hypothetical protein IT381_22480 [Deltaproteobacteria bacterium]|nr:hypothetical protein [Deltaproteobacteria bacterium]
MSRTGRAPEFRRVPPDGPGDPGGQFERLPAKKPEPRTLPPDGPGDPGGVVYEPAPKRGRLVRIPGDGPGDPGTTMIVEDKPTHKPYERSFYDC